MRILEEIDLRHVLVIDIETVSNKKTFEELEDNWKALWQRKAGNIIKNETDTPESIYRNAAIYSEFGKIISIGCGVFAKLENEWTFRVKTFSSHNEEELLHNFADMLHKHFNSTHFRFCSHNGREFDIPYLCRRMVINNIPLPQMLDMSGLKPWEVKHLDTMELWKFGDFKSYTSLNLLSAALGIPSPKDDIDGSMVGTVYWDENDLERIDKYCLKDVITTARVLMRMKGLVPFTDDKIIEG